MVRLFLTMLHKGERDMPPKQNPLKLNALQLKTLTLFQEMAKYPELSSAHPQGGTFIGNIPHPHGDHFHLGNKVVSSADATGFSNQAVWVALERKGMIRSSFPYALTLTDLGKAYETGMETKILHGTDH